MCILGCLNRLVHCATYPAKEIINYLKKYRHLTNMTGAPFQLKHENQVQCFTVLKQAEKKHGLDLSVFIYHVFTET